MNVGNFLTNLSRRKTIVTSTLHDTKLKRCLGIFDLVGLGICSLGVGIYVVTSYAIGSEAGPSYVISVIIAGVATLLAGLCYAEFSARLPRNGSAYLYTYVTLGEFCGFVIGWNMILEHVITGAIAAKAWSHYLDFMLNGTISSAVGKEVRLHTVDGDIITDIPDVTAFLLVLVVTILVAVHAKASTVVTLVLIFFNLLTITCFVVIGYFHVNHRNWTDSPGFFAHGFSGVLSGAATLIFTFTGLEFATSGNEETREPSRTSSSAIMYSVFITSVVYFCVSTAATLSLHTFPENALAALPEVLQSLKIHGASTVLSVGGLLALSASLTGACFYIPRLLYAMSSDKLIFRAFAKVSTSGHVSLLGVILPGLVIAVISTFIRIETLVQMASIGTLIAYTTVSISVICLRYQPGTSEIGICYRYEDADDADFMQCTDFTYADFQLDASKPMADRHSRFTANRIAIGRLHHLQKQHLNEKSRLTNGFSKYNKSLSFDDKIQLDKVIEHSGIYAPHDNTYTRLDSVISSTSNGSISGLLRLPSDVAVEPTEQTWRKVKLGLVLYLVLAILLSLLHRYCTVYLTSWWIIVILFIFFIMLISSMILVAKQPQNRTKFYFHTPYVPCIPLLAILIYIFLLASLPMASWVRFSIWMLPGLVLYFTYSYRHSGERQLDDQEVVLYEITDNSSNGAS